jgi:hypothetical protein
MKLFLLPVLIFAAFAVSSGQNTVMVGVETASIRSAPSVKAAVIKTAKQGESFELVAQSGSWSKVKVGKRFGWIHGNSLAAMLPTMATADRWGDPNSTYVIQQGNGTGPGMGTGRGTGIGQGVGNADAGKRIAEPSEPYAIAPNSELRITSKPKAEYTEAARRAMVNGTVQLKVTFLSSGAIGEVIPEKELPEGLTEQAINAAKGIRFQPKRINGVPQTVTKIIEYSFSIY